MLRDEKIDDFGINTDKTLLDNIIQAEAESKTLAETTVENANVKAEREK